MNEADNRRPLKSRNTSWAHWLTKRLAATRITANQISQASMIAAAICAVLFYYAGHSDGTLRVVLLLTAALFCQLRLLCNLMDGLVAIEAGKAAPDGPFWNEFPDRVADIMILVGVGYGIGEPALGWAASAFALFTAYVRELGRALGLDADFCGPMAKPHRMALVTLAALVSVFDPLWNGNNDILLITLWLITLGSFVTCIRRAGRILRQMR